MAPKSTPDQAATLALKALGYLVNFEPELRRFMELSGAVSGTLRDRADEPEFLAAVLDFLLTNEELLVGFCDAASADPRDVHMARHVLAGA
jgi:Protein of unknown function (DUF3572)